MIQSESFGIGLWKVDPTILFFNSKLFFNFIDSIKWNCLKQLPRAWLCPVFAQFKLTCSTRIIWFRFLPLFHIWPSFSVKPITSLSMWILPILPPQRLAFSYHSRIRSTKRRIYLCSSVKRKSWSTSVSVNTNSSWLRKECPRFKYNGIFLFSQDQIIRGQEKFTQKPMKL